MGVIGCSISYQWAYPVYVMIFFSQIMSQKKIDFSIIDDRITGNQTDNIAIVISLKCMIIKTHSGMQFI
jgi:hypothetical protein